MRRTIESLAIAAGLSLVASDGSLLAQGAKQGGSAGPVCPLLSVAEVNQATGRTDYARTWEVGPGQGVAGGSACVYEGTLTAYPKPPMLGFTLITAKNWTQQRRGVKLAAGCTREPVAGVGDAAFFESCPNSSKRKVDPLYAKVGSKDFIVEMKLNGGAKDPSPKRTVVAFAKALAAKLD